MSHLVRDLCGYLQVIPYIKDRKYEKRPLMLLIVNTKEDVSIFGITVTLEKMRKRLKNLFVFSGAAQARLYAFRAFKACATREWEILRALFAYRSFAFRAFH
jgi:hypothetical protein